jgi:dTDP-4-dehydrorhamnose reductase
MKLLMTGASGLLGLNAAMALAPHHEIIGGFLDHAIEVPHVRATRIDLSDAAAVHAWIADAKPDLVLHAAGLTNVDGCETNPALATRLNVTAAATVAQATARAGARLLHVSTDHLYDGSRSMYTETDPVSPVNVYADTKLEAERQVLRAHPSAFIIRTNFYGWGHPARQSFSDWILSGLRRGETLTMFHDVHFTPMLVNDLVDVMLDLAARAEPGIYNVAGGERLSKYAFGVAIASRFGFDPSRITPASADTFAFKARRPHDMSLDTGKTASALGYAMPSAAAGLDRLAALDADGLPGRLAAALRTGT